jgi:hypothetical protein
MKNASPGRTGLCAIIIHQWLLEELKVATFNLAL